MGYEKAKHDAANDMTMTGVSMRDRQSYEKSLRVCNTV